MGAAIDYRAVGSLPALFFDQARALGDKPLLWAKREDAYRPLSWREVEARIRDLARGLRALGIAPGDRVLLVSENRPEFFIATFAIMAARAIVVPAYTTNTPRDHAHVLRDSGAAAALVTTGALAGPLLRAVAEVEDCRRVVGLEPLPALAGPAAERVSLHDWHEVERLGAAAPDDIDALVAAVPRGETCCLIYTSGTGGAPKGVMLSHGNILCNCLGAYDLLKDFGLGDEVFLCFLPLSHSYEFTCGQMFPMSIGAQIYYAEGVDQLGRNMVEARPTIMTAVPRLYETMQARILRGLAKQSGLKRWLFATAERLGRKRYEDAGSLSARERLLDLLCEKLVRSKVRARFGGRLKGLVSGGGPLNPDVGLFFVALGLRLLQGYGQTEAAPVISCNRPFAYRMHTVGPPLKEVEVRIAEDGEILVRGELIMTGYWNQPEATAAVLRDGWLYTGDVGCLDTEGYLMITDRKKDIVVLSGGDNVSPARVEGFLTLQPEISQAMVSGDKRPHLVCLLVPDPDWLREWAASAGKTDELRALSGDEDLRKALAQAVERVNREVSGLERVRHFAVAPEPFSIENEMLTPSLKVRRHVVRRHYGAQLDALYG
ncbi:MAG: long-chain fatty acid--CoA ligase [Tistlia sp.]|uniref:long-chain fatty acid--CoA ligase n=1 Tax=Tistlia sp. TaxID=3057121 RepID=UPI0034A163FC